MIAPSNSITPDRKDWLYGYRGGYTDSVNCRPSKVNKEWSFSLLSGYHAGYAAGQQHPDNMERKLLDSELSQLPNDARFGINHPSAGGYHSAAPASEPEAP